MSEEKTEKEKTYGVFKSPQESMIELIKKLSDVERICMFSDYNDEEIQNFALLEAFNGILHSQILDIYIKRHDMRRVSKQRLGRRELVTVSHNLNPLVMPMDMVGGAGLKDRIKSLLYRRR